MAELKRYVVGFAFNAEESRVLLISKTRPEWQAGRLNGVGGHIEADEDSLSAMRREFREEVEPPEAASWRLFARLSGDGFEVFFFRGVLHGIGHGLTDEVTVWVDPDALPEAVIPNLRWLIPMARSRQCNDWPFDLRERA